MSKEASPELIGRNSVKYPIEDSLINMLPELHGAKAIPAKPAMRKIPLDADDFERLLHIWEFCNNFNDYLETPTFKIEDLRVALLFQEPPAS